MIKKKALQEVIFPNNEICNIKEMFFRSHYDVYDERYNKLIFSLEKFLGEKVMFDTYFNSFNLCKWRKYTKLKKLYFSFSFKGKLKLKLVKSSLSNNMISSETFYENIFESDNYKKENIYIDFSNFKKREDIYFELIPYKKETEFFDASYNTEIESENINEIKLGLATCTYKKEDYLNKNLEIIKKYITEKHENYKITTYIVDNASSISLESLNEFQNIKLVHSKNLGASGGFARAFLESINNGDSHVISLDDDILLNPYSVILVYNFLEMMKEEYLEYGIGGAMLVFDKKYLQHDSGAYIYPNKLFGINAHLDLRVYSNVLKNTIEGHYSKVFNGFWFCCYSTNLLKEKGLTIPFFMKGDDVEIGVRTYNNNFITLNSVCVWHEDFFKKFTPVFTNFYEVRNLLILNLLIFENYSLKNAYELIFKRVIRELVFYRYEGCDLIFEAVKTFLKGTKDFENKDNEKVVKSCYIYKTKKIPELNVEFDYDIYQNSVSILEETKIKRALRILSFNGYLLPNFLFKSFNIVPIVTASLRRVYKYKILLHYDYDNDMGYTTKINRFKALKVLKDLIFISVKLLFKFKTVKKDFQENATKLSKIDFWQARFSSEEGE